MRRQTHITSHRHYHDEGMPCVEYEVLVEGERYRMNEHSLALLQDGVALDEIDMVRVEGVDD
jgi:hypothetical protein